MISFSEFEQAVRSAPGMRWIPVTEEVPVDRETPVSLLEKWRAEPFLFLLESVEGGETWGRYSFLGFAPSIVFKGKGCRVEVFEGGRRRVDASEDPLRDLRDYFQNASPLYRTLPRFAGGAIGYSAYDAVRLMERLPEKSRDDLGVPDLFFVFPSLLLVLDNLRHSLQVVCNVRLPENVSRAALQRQYESARKKITAVIRKIAGRPAPGRRQRRRGRPAGGSWKATVSERDFCSAVEKVRSYILAGDVTQTVLSIRFSQKAGGDPLDLYRALRQVNPSPYMFFTKFRDLTLVGASPETMVRLENGEMVLRPIAGTRRRGADREEDLRLEKELLADAKERAEHIMLVDLGRNDLGRVARGGSVKVDELMSIERYSHVMHIVSNVRAALAPGKDAFDVLKATFPAGTLTGSPKIRAMEIIEELEPVRRGTYGGAVGYFSFSGSMDLAITIRSALIYGGKIFVQAGAGIVADSIPEREYQECLNKARGMMEAVKKAREIS